jgi:hypothetical protein
VLCALTEAAPDAVGGLIMAKTVYIIELTAAVASALTLGAIVAVAGLLLIGYP